MKDFVCFFSQNEVLQEEGLTERYDIAEFIAWVHESYCTKDTSPVSRSFTPSTEEIPDVRTLGQLVMAFSELLQQKKKAVHTKVSVYQSTILSCVCRKLY